MLDNKTISSKACWKHTVRKVNQVLVERSLPALVGSQSIIYIVATCRLRICGVWWCWVAQRCPGIWWSCK